MWYGVLVEIEVVDEELFERRVVKDGSFNVTQSRGELEAWIAKTSSAKQCAWKRQRDHNSTYVSAHRSGSTKAEDVIGTTCFYDCIVSFRIMIVLFDILRSDIHI